MQNEGDVCVCNFQTQSLETGTKEKIYLHQHGLEAAWNSPTRKMIAAGLDRGTKVSGCKTCWDLEDAGAASPRQNRNNLLQQVTPLKQQPKILIIKAGNVCNLACRMCGPETSTSLYQDYYHLDTERATFTGTFKEYTSKFESIRAGFNANNEKIWKTLEDWSDQLIFIDIYGGEPMLTTALWSSLQRVVDQGHSKNIDLQLHTNAMIWQDAYIEILKQFKSVNIGISIDSHIPEHLAYIRHKSNASTIFANLEKYKKLCQEVNTIKCKITVTVSIYNAFYLDEIISGLNKYGVRAEVNFVHSPGHYDVRHLPKPVKTILSHKIQNTKLKTLLGQTLPGCDILWPEFCKEMQILDRIRGQNFADTFPEWYSLLKPFIVDYDKKV
jgi:MoaA/NifB/PqqE/SkfB family radical SAM enzyme